MKKLLLSASLLFALPLLVAAQQLQPISNLVGAIGRVVASLIPILITIALVVFFWGLIKYIWGSGKGHDQGRKVMIAGLASLFVMVSIWGIVFLAQDALGINRGAPVQSPGVPVPR